MPEDRSLDDFASAGSDEGDPAAGSGSAETDSTEADVETDPADVEPAESTSTWSADGADCDRCGTTVPRRWRDDGEFVCADCADW